MKSVMFSSAFRAVSAAWEKHCSRIAVNSRYIK